MTCLLESSHMRQGAAPGSPGSPGHAWALDTASLLPSHGFWEFDLPTGGKRAKGSGFLTVSCLYRVNITLCQQWQRSVAKLYVSSSTATAQQQLKAGMMPPSAACSAVHLTLVRLPRVSPSPYLTSECYSKTLTRSSSRPVHWQLDVVLYMYCVRACVCFVALAAATAPQWICSCSPAGGKRAKGSGFQTVSGMYKVKHSCFPAPNCFPFFSSPLQPLPRFLFPQLCPPQPSHTTRHCICKA